MQNAFDFKKDNWLKNVLAVLIYSTFCNEIAIIFEYQNFIESFSKSCNFTPESRSHFSPILTVYYPYINSVMSH